MGARIRSSVTNGLAFTVAVVGIVSGSLSSANGQNQISVDGEFIPEHGVLFDAKLPADLRSATSVDGTMRVETAFKKIRVWSTEGEELVHEFVTTGHAFSPTFSRDGKYLIASVCSGNLECRSTLFSWDLSTGDVTRLGECTGTVIDIDTDAACDRVVATTAYGPLFTKLLVMDREKKAYCGEITIFRRGKPESTVQIHCELPELLGDMEDDDILKDADSSRISDELDKRVCDANRSCLPIRISLTPDGAKVIAATSSGIIHVFDSVTGNREVTMSHQGRTGSEFFYADH